MIATGSQIICLVPATDTHFSQAVFLQEILREGQYESEDEGTELWDQQVWNETRTHRFKAVVGDHEKFDQILTWSAANIPLNLWVFGLENTRIWMENTSIRCREKQSQKTGEVIELEISMAVSKAGALITRRINILDPTDADGSNANEFTVTSASFGTVTPNGSFTTAVGNALRLTASTPGTFAKALNLKKIPAIKGMVFSLRGNIYGSGGTSGISHRLQLIGHDGSGAITETLSILTASNGLAVLSGSLAIAHANTRYVRLELVTKADVGNSVCEFDNLIVMHGPAVPTSFINN